jgi:hypothetical protein
MSRAAALLDWLEDKSDWLSPIVVKEVRQTVRGREFHYSFGLSLVVALAIAFYGAAAADGSDGTTGAGTFTALMVCLTLLGMLVVPIGAFSALRTERLEQTLDLVTVTALSPRRVVVGKLMAQAVKLVTLFAALAPFMAMSFLLGGIDFVTILISLGVLFLWSLWAASIFLFLSTLFKSRAMSGAVFGAAGIAMFFVLTVGRVLPFTFMRGGPLSRGDFWWALAMLMTGCVVTTVNFVLLAESRLVVPTQNRVTPLRIGFFVQFMLIVAWSLSYLASTGAARGNAAEALAVIGGLHLAIVAMFGVTDDLSVPRRVLAEMQRGSRRDWLLLFVRPGAGRAAAYVLAQMAVLVLAASVLDPSAEKVRWRLGICAYICFFSGVPVYLWRRLRPNRGTAFHLRVMVLMVLAVAVILPDVLFFVFGQSATFDAGFGRRHLMNPFRGLANWPLIEKSGWLLVPALFGTAGLAAYGGLIHLGALRRSAERMPDGAVAVD